MTRKSSPLIGVALAAVAASLGIAPDARGMLAAALALIVITIAASMRGTFSSLMN